MGKIKLGIVGCGWITNLHQQVFNELKDKIEVVGTCARHQESAERTAKFLGAKYAVTDWKQLFDVADSFLVALPINLHYQAGMEMIEAGKHVLMEKPLGVTEKECLTITQAAEDKNVKLMVAYIMRFHPMVAKLKEIIEKKTYGDFNQMSIWTEQFTYYPEGHWLRKKETSGGGQFFTHGCHYVDLLLWMMGNPVKGAHFGTRKFTEWMDTEGTSNAIFEFENGRLAYHYGTWAAKGTRHSYSIQTQFEEGLVECCLNEGKMYLHQTKDLGNYSEVSDEPELIFTCETTSHLPKYEIEYFADCVIKNVHPMTDGKSTLQGHRVIWRMYEAERRNIIADLSGLGIDNEEWKQEGLYKLPDTKDFIKV